MKENSPAGAPKYGWMKDEPDKRDYHYHSPPEIAKSLPSAADLRRGFPRAYNQGNLNSCTANAIAAAIEFDEIRQKVERPFIPSRLFIYYNERVMEGSVDSDSGAQIRSGIKSVARLGSCRENQWPYVERNLKVRPTGVCFRRAVKYKVLEYRRLRHDLVQMKACLASGFPFVFGIKVYSAFENAAVGKSGHLHLPAPSEKFVGKHAVVASGYDDSKGWFIARNSWGARWGIEGYFTIPYEYLLDRGLSADFWTIRMVR